jgi:hypothetical protein
MKKSTRLIILAVLVFVVCLTTTLSLVYFVGGINAQNKTGNLPTVEIGVGGSATLTINLGATQRVGGGTEALIPQYISPTAGQTQQIQYTVPVTWTTPTSDLTGKTGILAASVNSIKVAGDVAEYKSVTTTNSSTFLFDISFGYAPNTTITANSGTVTVTVTVKMNEPADPTQYNKVAGKQITIELLFTATPNWS